MLRMLDAEFFPSDPFLGNYNRSGQQLFSWHTPDGFPDSKAQWGGTAPMLERWRIANQLVNNNLQKVHVDVLASSKAVPPRAAPLAKFWRERILGGVKTNNEELFAEILAQGKSVEAEIPEKDLKQRLPAMVALIMMSPEFQLK
jgi:hypothetical protein